MPILKCWSRWWRSICPICRKHIIAPAIKGYIEVVRAWPQNGGDTSILDDTVKFFTDNGELKTAVNTKEIVDAENSRRAR